MSQTTKPVYSILCVDEFTGYSDYWSGHGHVFEKEAIGCITLVAYVNYSETEKEIQEQLLEDQTEFEDLTEDQHLDLDLGNETVERFLKANFNSRKPFFDATYDRIEETNDFEENPIYLIVLHVYEENKT